MENSEYLNVERAEALLLIRWAAATLNLTEKLALAALMTDATQSEAAQVRGCTRGGIFMAKMSGLEKMRRRLAQLGITSSSQVLS